MNDNADPGPVCQNIIKYRRVIDLSQVIHPNIPRWPGDPPVEFETVARIPDQGYYLRRFSLGEHTGTHINAPRSFDPAGISVDGYDARSLVAPAVVLDRADRAKRHADYLLAPEDVYAWEQRYGLVPPGCLVLLYTGGQERWIDPQGYFNLDAGGTGHFPGFGIEAARVLVNQRQIAGIGIDTPGVDGGRDRTFAVNRLMLEQPRIVLENLTRLERLPPTGATLVIGLLRLAGGSGSPASVLALAP